jgi:hypothetical protein
MAAHPMTGIRSDRLRGGRADRAAAGDRSDARDAADLRVMELAALDALAGAG